MAVIQLKEDKSEFGEAQELLLFIFFLDVEQEVLKETILSFLYIRDYGGYFA